MSKSDNGADDLATLLGADETTLLIQGKSFFTGELNLLQMARIRGEIKSLVPAIQAMFAKLATERRPVAKSESDDGREKAEEFDVLMDLLSSIDEPELLAVYKILAIAARVPGEDIETLTMPQAAILARDLWVTNRKNFEKKLMPMIRSAGGESNRRGTPQPGSRLHKI